MMLLGQLAAVPQTDRVSPRRAVNFAGFVREMGAEITPVEVSNISPEGCCFKASAEFERSGTLWLKIPGLTARQLKVIWRTDDAFGCQFATPMSSSAIDQFCSNHRRERLHAARTRNQLLRRS